MLRFLRTLRLDFLRETGARRYLKYALGEIALVVIGILIALQINNWNEDRLDRKREREYLYSMITDLHEDLDSMGKSIQGNSFIVARLGDLLRLLDQPLGDQDHRRQIYLRSIVYTYWYTPVEFSELTIAQLKSSGTLRLIADAEVRRAMLKYEQGVASCRYQYAEIPNYFHVHELSQKQLFNMRLATRVFERIEENHLNMFDPLETYERLVPEGPYLLDDDPKLLATYFADAMFFRTALNTHVTLLESQRAMAQSLIDLIRERYAID